MINFDWCVLFFVQYDLIKGVVLNGIDWLKLIVFVDIGGLYDNEIWQCFLVEC